MKHLLPILLAFAPALALADAKSEAKQHIQKATELHAASKFAEALEELQRAYALDPKPALLYAMGQVHVQLGDCPKAITFYERYLATGPGPGPTAATREAIETCQREAPPPEPVPAPVAAPPPPVAAPPPPAVAPASTPWYEDVIGDALVGAGIAAGVVSIVFYRQMSGKLDDAEAAMTYDAHQDARDAAAGKRNLALGFGIGGVALVGAGIVRYVLRDRGDEPRKLTLAPSANGITVTGRF